MAEQAPRLLNFISEQQLEEVKQKRGGRVEDGSVAVDRPLFEILKENKDKQQAEFNERFKHRPPKALDEEESEFLENLEMRKKVLEKQLADEDAQQLQNFKAAVANRTIRLEEPKSLLQTEEQPKTVVKEKRPTQTRPLANLIRIKARPKKSEPDDSSIAPPDAYDSKNPPSMCRGKEDDDKQEKTGLGLVAYDDESGEEDQ